MKEQVTEYKKALTIGKLGFWQWDSVTNKTYWGDENLSSSVTNLRSLK